MRSSLPTKSSCYRTPDTLVVGGGGMRGIHGLGAIARLRKEGHLAEVKHVVGTSSGAILGYMYATDQLERGLGLALRQKPLRDIRIDRIVKGFGVDSGKTLDEFLEKLSEPVGNLSFSELLEKSGIDLHVTVSNISKRRVEYFCASETPNASVVAAVRDSCTIPGLFCVRSRDGDVYADGGLVDNFPILRGRLISDTGQVLGICYENYPEELDDINDIRSFLAAVFETISSPPPNVSLLPTERVLVIESERITLDFGAEPSKRFDWFCVGAHQARAFLKKLA